MIKLIYKEKGKIKYGFIDGGSDPYIIRNANGSKEFHFKANKDTELYPFLLPENIIEKDDIFFRIKEIVEKETETEFVATLDRDDMKTIVFEQFKTTECTIMECLTLALEDTPWRIDGVFNPIRRTVELEDCTPYDVVMEAASIYDVLYDYDTKKKVITIINKSDIENKGLFVDERLNLISCEYNADTYDIVTRIYPYGYTDDNGNTVDITTVNDGLEYLSNNDYTERYISMIWRDERYKDPYSLYDAALEKLNELSRPLESYVLETKDISKIDADYGEYSMKERDIVRYYDKYRKRTVMYTILEYEEHYKKPENDKITLSSAPISLEKVMNSTAGDIKEQSIKTKDFLKESKEYVNNMMNIEGKDSNIVFVKNEAGKITEILAMDTNDINTAKKIMKFNKSGIAGTDVGVNGEFKSAMLSDGTIVADMITAGVLKSINIEGVEINGSNIIGGTITGKTNINVGTDLYVGNNVYLGEQTGDESAKNIYLDKNNYMFLAHGPDYDQIEFVLKKNGFHYMSLEAAANRNTITTNMDMSVNKLSCESLFCAGSKHRIVETLHFGTRAMNAIESTIAVFEDFGSAITDENGVSIVRIDKVFIETVNTTLNYFVYLSPCDDGRLFIKNKYSFAFVVHGDPLTRFDWRIVAKQKGYEKVRMEEKRDAYE